MVFAANSVMLREHFRCVPAIIEYSKREFYEHQMKPLRIPKRSERLDPGPAGDCGIDRITMRGAGNQSRNAAQADGHAVVEIPRATSRALSSSRSLSVVNSPT